MNVQAFEEIYKCLHLCVVNVVIHIVCNYDGLFVHLLNKSISNAIQQNI